ncbi:MAG: Rha family transcriptional regulator [Coleofasciculus sp. C3-bin4]|nr:Rha family transcriptional regulator [Coleofasciculus sp. C3-bin4]
MTDLEIIEDGGDLYVDSRLIAERLGIEHESFLRTLDTYQTEAEQAFGIFRFEIGKTKGRGRPPRYALLNENQATFIMTLSRNTPEVVQCKLDLVRSFSRAKELLRRANPLADIDRAGLRSTLKDDSRLRMTDQVKVYLEQIKRYDDKNYRGRFFAQVHDAINLSVTGETARDMRDRLSALLSRKVTEKELLRDYYPSMVLQRYISLCETSANFMIHERLAPLDAVDRAAQMVLYVGYQPTPIDFVEHIKFVRQRLATGQGGFELPGF